MLRGAGRDDDVWNRISNTNWLLTFGFREQGTRRRPQAGSSCPPPLPFDSDESWKTAGYGRGSSGSAGMWASGGTSGGVGAALGVGGGGDDRFTPSLTQRSSLRTSRSSGIAWHA
jgi:hypothetical protein